MSRIRGMLRGAMVLAASVMLVGAAGAQDGATDPPPAPTPEEVVGRCLHEMGGITRTTLGVLRERTERGVGAIIDLAQSDASPPQIIHTGEIAKGACAMAARRGQHALDESLERCLRVLREIEAPREAFGVVVEARRRLGAVIGDALIESTRRINRAVARALGAGAAPVGEPGAIVESGAVLVE